jgi:N-acetylmuramoyl-L-alanine amidase
MSAGSNRTLKDVAQALRLCPRLVVCLALTLTLAAPVVAQHASRTSESLAQKKAAAAEQFAKAEKLRTALHGKPQADRAPDEYRQAIVAYRRVYLITPHAVEVPAALLAVAELYHEMGRHLDARFHKDAVEAYLFLMKHYPASRYRDDALFTIGHIQHEDLAQLDAAEDTFQEFLQRFPRSPQAPQARERLQAIAREREKERAGSRKQVAEERAQQRKMPRVTSLRHWNAENYTRVVIDVEDAVQYQAARIANPDRIYFDLSRAKLSPTLAGKTLQLEGGFLKAVRVAQNQEGVVRVVLEVDKVKDYSVFTLPNPFRLVIDVHGQPLVVAKAAAPPDPSKPAEIKAPAPASPQAEETKSAPAPSGEKQPRKVARSEQPAQKPAEKSGASATQVARTDPPPLTPSAPANQPEKEREKKAAAGSSAATPSVATNLPPPQPTRHGQTTTRVLGLKVAKIVIDPGHGGHDTGTIGPTGLMEKDVCLDVALRLGRMIRDRMPETEVIFTREDDSFVPLENRTGLANQVRADMFLSIHANSSRDKRTRGVETYYLNFAASDEAMEVAARENVLSQASISELQDIIKKIANNEKLEESRELAVELQASLSKRLQRVNRSAARNRGVKKAPFVVLIGANMPSVLAEVSFLSNPGDESLLKKPEHRQRLAEGLYQGVETYLQNLGSLTFNRGNSAPPVSR